MNLIFKIVISSVAFLTEHGNATKLSCEVFFKYFFGTKTCIVDCIREFTKVNPTYMGRCHVRSSTRSSHVFVYSRKYQGNI